MIRIITDSTSDISQDDAKKFGITVIPLTVRFGEEEFKEGIDLTSEEFYERLTANYELPSTSQINPSVFEEVFSQFPDDDILGLFISSKLSGTYQSANIAKDMLERDNIKIVDSLSATIGLDVLVRAAIKLRDEGVAFDELVSTVAELVGKVKVCAALDTLTYLEKGGRISKVASILGNLASINPIVDIIDGEVTCTKKVRGLKKIYSTIEEYVANCPIDSKYDIVLGNSNAKDKAAALIEAFPQMLGNAVVSNLGSAVGTYTGPGAFGIAYIAK